MEHYVHNCLIVQVKEKIQKHKQGGGKNTWNNLEETKLWSEN